MMSFSHWGDVCSPRDHATSISPPTTTSTWRMSWIVTSVITRYSEHGLAERRVRLLDIARVFEDRDDGARLRGDLPIGGIHRRLSRQFDDERGAGRNRPARCPVDHAGDERVAVRAGDGRRYHATAA